MIDFLLLNPTLVAIVVLAAFFAITDAALVRGQSLAARSVYSRRQRIRNGR